MLFVYYLHKCCLRCKQVYGKQAKGICTSFAGQVWKCRSNQHARYVYAVLGYSKSRTRHNVYCIHTPYNRFTALWILPGTTRVSRYQKKHSPTHSYRMVISHPLSTSSICYHPWHPSCSIYVPDNLCPSFLWSTSWPGTLHFILHTFLHPIIFFSQHMPIPSQPVLL